MLQSTLQNATVDALSRICSLTTSRENLLNLHKEIFLPGSRPYKHCCAQQLMPLHMRNSISLSIGTSLPAWLSQTWNCVAKMTYSPEQARPNCWWSRVEVNTQYAWVRYQNRRQDTVFLRDLALVGKELGLATSRKKGLVITAPRKLSSNGPANITPSWGLTETVELRTLTVQD